MKFYSLVFFLAALLNAAGVSAEVSVRHKSLLEWEQGINSKIWPNISTKSDVRQLLGKPDRITATPLNDVVHERFKETWEYACPGTHLNDKDWCIAEVIFDAKGHVSTRGVNGPNHLDGPLFH